MELLYSGTRDGSTANIFHNKCDNKGPTLCLYQNDKNNIFGGFASISWTSAQSGIYFSAPESFLFTLTNIHGTKPEKFLIQKKIVVSIIIKIMEHYLVVMIYTFEKIL